jgi:hypothetical protein
MLGRGVAARLLYGEVVALRALLTLERRPWVVRPRWLCGKHRAQVLAFSLVVWTARRGWVLAVELGLLVSSCSRSEVDASLDTSVLPLVASCCRIWRPTRCWRWGLRPGEISGWSCQP